MLTRLKAHYPLEPAGIQLFARIQKLARILHEVTEGSLRLKIPVAPDQLKKLITLKEHLQDLLTTQNELQDQVKSFYGMIDAVRDLFRDADLTEKKALVKFRALMARIQRQAMRKEVSSMYRKGYEMLLKTMKAWRSKLFKYKSIKHLPRTNNSLEQFFNEKKTWLRRTSGVKQGNRTFKLFGTYILFINMSLTKTDIINLLNQVNYSEVIRKLKVEQQKAHRRFQISQKVRTWEADLENIYKNIFMSAEVS